MVIASCFSQACSEQGELKGEWKDLKSFAVCPQKKHM
jgi:hypothetical protein